MSCRQRETDLFLMPASKVLLVLIRITNKSAPFLINVGRLPNKYRVCRIMSTRFPALFQFLAGYFHEDWRCDHASGDDVVRAFVAESSQDRISQAKDELQVVLRSIQSEEELKTFLFKEIGLLLPLRVALSPSLVGACF